MPEVGDNDVLIKNIMSSICGTDVAVYNNGPNTGHKINVGKEFGHETISRVVQVGKNVKDIKVGQRVYPYPLFVKDDTKRAGTIGGFSEYILAKNAKLNYSLYNVYDEISDKTASLIEPFTVGCRSARRSNIVKDEKAVVFGCGTIGIAAAIALKWFGASKVMICDISDYRLKIAKNLGFEVCNTNKEDFKEISLYDVLDIMKSGKWDIESIITCEYPIEDLSKAIEKASDANSALNVIINYNL